MYMLRKIEGSERGIPLTVFLGLLGYLASLDACLKVLFLPLLCRDR